LAEPGVAAPRLLASVDGQSPVWRRDGAMVTLSQGKSGSLAVRLIESKGATGDMLTLPIDAGSSYAARWDLDHSQALVARKTSASPSGPRTEFWLVSFQETAP